MDWERETEGGRGSGIPVVGDVTVVATDEGRDGRVQSLLGEDVHVSADIGGLTGRPDAPSHGPKGGSEQGRGVGTGEDGMSGWKEKNGTPVLM